MSPTSSRGGPVAVLGSGAWGTVLASLLASAGSPVRLWARRRDQAALLASRRENPEYLPGFPLPPSVRPTADLAEAVAGVEFAVVAVPSRAVRALVRSLPTQAGRGPALVVAAKGIERHGFLRLSEVVEAERPGTHVAVLSGPNLAAEIAAGKPAAATAASHDGVLARRLQTLLLASCLRVYTSEDVIGVEVAGALKNVIALAAGMSDGLGLGDNSKAALITRGLAEIARLGTKLGGDPRTFHGLAGLGDLVATCASAQSRNHLAGVRFARGASLADIEASHLTAEGIPTVLAVHDKAREADLDLPICSEVYRVVYEGKAVAEALRALTERAARAE